MYEKKFQEKAYENLSYFATRPHNLLYLYKLYVV